MKHFFGIKKAQALNMILILWQINLSNYVILVPGSPISQNLLRK